MSMVCLNTYSEEEREIGNREGKASDTLFYSTISLIIVEVLYEKEEEEVIDERDEDTEN